MRRCAWLSAAVPTPGAPTTALMRPSLFGWRPRCPGRYAGVPRPVERRPYAGQRARRVRVCHEVCRFIRRDRLHIVQEWRIEGAPDLVVEVLSPSTRRRDLPAKLHIYARFGVPHYWVLDAGARTVQPYELGEAGYAARPLL